MVGQVEEEWPAGRHLPQDEVRGIIGEPLGEGGEDSRLLYYLFILNCVL